MKLLVRSFVLLLVFCAATHAQDLEIQLVDVDIEFDGTEITAAGGLDDLSGLFIFVDGISTAEIAPDEPGELVIELSIPGLDSLEINGTATSDPGGFLRIIESTGGSSTTLLDLALDGVEVTFDQITFTPVPDFTIDFEFAFGGTIAELDSQALPTPSLINSSAPLSVSLLTTVSSFAANDEGEVTEFSASGSSTITGLLIPEPGTISLAGLMIIGLVPYRRRPAA